MKKLKKSSDLHLRATGELKDALGKIPTVKAGEHTKSWMAHQLLEEVLGLKPRQYLKFVKSKRKG